MSSNAIYHSSYGPRQANLVLIAYASSEGSGEPARPNYTDIDIVNLIPLNFNIHIKHLYIQNLL